MLRASADALMHNILRVASFARDTLTGLINAHQLGVMQVAPCRDRPQVALVLLASD